MFSKKYIAQNQYLEIKHEVSLQILKKFKKIIRGYF